MNGALLQNDPAMAIQWIEWRPAWPPPDKKAQQRQVEQFLAIQKELMATYSTIDIEPGERADRSQLVRGSGSLAEGY